MSQTRANIRWLTTIIGAALVALTWLTFGQTLGHEFVNYDDNAYVYQNPIVLRGLTLDGIAWAFTHAHSGNWHPLTSISHMLDCQFYGLNAGGHHLTNVLLHSIAVLLFPHLTPNDQGVLAERICRGGFRDSSAASGIRGLGGRTQGCLEWRFFYADSLGVRFLRSQSTVTWSLPRAGLDICFWSAFEAQFGDSPYLALTARLLAAATVRRSADDGSIEAKQLVGSAIVNSADDSRKNSAARAFGWLVVRNDYRATTHHELNGVNPSDVAHEKRGGELLRLCLADVLAGALGGFLSSPAKYYSVLGNLFGAGFPRWHLGSGSSPAAQIPLSGGRLVLVSRNACADDWIGSGRVARASRSIYLSATDRSLHND